MSRAATLLLAGAAMVAPSVASAADITVNDDTSGPGPARATCAAPDESTISAAVTAATAGDTVLVCAGTYNESVVVDKQLTLRGARAGVDARTRGPATAATESVITGQPSAAADGGVALEATGVVFDGFVVTSAADPAIGAGIAMSQTENGNRVVNSVIRDSPVGISANSSGGALSIIRRNHLENNNAPGPDSGNAINGAGDVDDLTIDENSFTDQTNAAIRLTETGGVNSNLEITGNDFDGTSVSPTHNDLRVQLLHTQSATIAGNDFSEVADSAVHLAGNNDGITVQGNSMVSGPAAVRVTDAGSVGENRNVRVLGNNVVRNEAGISVGADGLSGALTATGNRIAHNGTGIVLDDTDATVAADDNWWGCNEGLPSPDCDSIGGANAAAIDTSQVLTLAIRAPRTIRPRRKRTITASIEGDTPCLFPDGITIRFATNKGRLRRGSAPTEACTASVRLKARRRNRGNVTVAAFLDNQAVEDTIRIKRN